MKIKYIGVYLLAVSDIWKYVCKNKYRFRVTIIYAAILGIIVAAL